MIRVRAFELESSEQLIDFDFARGRFTSEVFAQAAASLRISSRVQAGADTKSCLVTDLESEHEYRDTLVIIIALVTLCLSGGPILLTPFVALEMLLGVAMVVYSLTIGSMAVLYSFATLCASRDYRRESTVVIGFVTGSGALSVLLTYAASCALGGWTALSITNVVWSAVVLVLCGVAGGWLPWALPRRKHSRGQLSLAAILFVVAVSGGWLMVLLSIMAEANSLL